MYSMKQIKVSFTQEQLDTISFLLWNQISMLTEEGEGVDDKRTLTLYKQIGTKISKALNYNP
jgi:hypothetical protein